MEHYLKQYEIVSGPHERHKASIAMVISRSREISGPPYPHLDARASLLKLYPPHRLLEPKADNHASMAVHRLQCIS